VDRQLSKAFTGLWKGRELVWKAARDLPVILEAEVEAERSRLAYQLTCRFFASAENLPNQQAFSGEERASYDSASVDLMRFGGAWTGVSGLCHPPDEYNWPEPPSGNELDAANVVHNALANVHYYRWIPKFLALPATINSERKARMATSGFGLATLLDEILSYDRERFVALEDRFREVFPQVAALRLLPGPAFREAVDDPAWITQGERTDGKGLYIHFIRQTLPTPASQVSDGMLIVLAYLALLYLPEPPRVILVEEPENGIHPKRLQDVLKILRELVEEQSHTQVIMTTHSPYVVDMFQPEEVTHCRPEEDGSVSVRKLSDVDAVRRQLDVFTLGEIWTAEGDAVLSQSATPGMDTGG
jgi:hypothetical protein